VQDSFAWEQEVIGGIADWISAKNFTLAEAFKALDQDCDGCVGLQDLRSFVTETLKFEVVAETKLQRLYQILDVSKSGRIFPSDFEATFSQRRKLLDTFSSLRSRHTGVSLAESLNWQASCI